MKSIKIILLAVASAGFVSVQAQQETPGQLVFGGMVVTRDLVWAPDMAQLSRTQPFGTARSMGMGGAFTSLGADLTSMSLNPAGLGMYRRNEFSLTPMVSVAHGQTPGTGILNGDNKTRFAFANVGMALNVYESSKRALTSVTLGFGLNRIADFNQRYSFTSESRYKQGAFAPTIAEIFAQQLNRFGVRPDGPGGDGSANGTVPIDSWNPNLWPAILGYDGYMIGNYGTVEKPDWKTQYIGDNASVLHSLDVLGSGSINEFTISAGANFNNIVYVGATLGIQSVYQKVGVTYGEQFNYYNGAPVNGAGQPLDEYLNDMSLYQGTTLDGSGVNFKLGVVVRPVAGLRIGAAFHTPTFYSLSRKYSADIVTNGNQSGKPFQSGNYATAYNEGSNSWDFVSPSRLLLGASYTFGTFAIVSVDYQRDWYNGIRVKNTPENTYTPETYKAEFKQNFQATSTLRAGVEVRPLPMLALRVGGGYSGSMLKDKNYYVNRGAGKFPTSGSMPVSCENYYFSVGVGVNLSRSMTLDFAYQNVTDKQTDYQLFYSYPEPSGEFETFSGVYNTSLTRHYIAMTLSFRF